MERNRANNNAWVDEVKHDLCEVLRLKKQFIVIFEFDSPRHRGNLQEAILEALLNCRFDYHPFILGLGNLIDYLFLAAKFSGDNMDEQQCLVTELKLSMV